MSDGQTDERIRESSSRYRRQKQPLDDLRKNELITIKCPHCNEAFILTHSNYKWYKEVEDEE